MTTTTTTDAAPSAWRAWWYLVWLSMQRQARARAMVWIALGLLAFSVFLVAIQTRAGYWSMAHWRWPRRDGPMFADLVAEYQTAAALPWPIPEAGGIQMVSAAYTAVLYEGSGFFVFSAWIVFSVFCTFLLPLWTLSFATEGLGREREARNLLWVLTRPLSRSAIYFAKLTALLPWCLLLNMGGFALLCFAAGHPGRLAFRVYWPAVLWGTIGFAALFHLLGATMRRPAVVALLYVFFLETVMGNMPGHFKRFSISFYIRCLMFDRAHEFGIRPERPEIFLPVNGTTAWLVLAGVSIALSVLGAVLFTRNEELDLV